MRCPASVATVITCQRRREEAERPVAEARERLATPCDRAPADESAHAIPRARGGVADPAGALLAGEDEREADDRDREDDDRDQRSRLQRRMPLVGGREQRERDDWEHEVRELIPDTRDRDCKPDRARAEPPGAEHRVRRRHPDRGAGRRDDRERSRGLRHRHALPVAQPRQRRHPGRREGREVEEHRGRQGRPVLPVEVAQHVEHVAVVRDARQDEDEDENDDRDRAGAAEEPLVRRRQPSPARCRAVRHLQEPTVRPLES